jgi:hypothetical protein
VVLAAHERLKLFAGRESGEVFVSPGDRARRLRRGQAERGDNDLSGGAAELGVGDHDVECLAAATAGTSELAGRRIEHPGEALQAGGEAPGGVLTGGDESLLLAATVALANLARLAALAGTRNVEASCTSALAVLAGLAKLPSWVVV